MSVLESIFAERRADVEWAKSEVPLAELKAKIRDVEPPRGFRRALADRKTDLALIAEIKPASPSQGDIAPNLDPADVAKQYLAAGAHALSVLTEPRHFGGRPENIALARQAVPIPALRKDFVDDPYQVYESRALGADAILLIVAALDPSQIRELSDLAQNLGMDVLVEVHSEPELEVAIAAQSDLIGVNSRDLSTLKTDLRVAERLLPMIPKGVIRIAESALSTREDVERVKGAGADGVLIGTAFCASPKIPEKVREVMNWPCG
ncbi:MAG TPA: indole-3-glycerol phosphate synthase TrpC [Fimbriimonadaceae bacterium]|nr:indole-3-glycerol phosphate synthase TrpC [Fimbriimonadaceae bacterium]